MNNTNFLPDSKKTDLDANDFFDKIINVKIVAGKDNEAETEYVIRSDYEIQYEQYKLDNLFDKEFVPNTYNIRRCTYKPAIKLQYKMVTAETGTEVDLFISNFYMFTSDGKSLRNFTSEDYPISRVEIALGYWGQFKQSNEAIKRWKITDLFNIYAPSGKAGRLVIRDAIVVSTESLPPDYAIHIHGYVANISYSAVGEGNVTTFAQADKNAIATTEVVGKRSEIEEIFYKEITRRFLREKIVNKGNKAKSLITNTGVLNHSPVVSKETGLMTDTDAKLYGVQVYVSDKVREIELSEITDSDGKKVENKAYFESGDSIGATMNRIRTNICPNLLYRFMDDGNMLVFLSEESSEEGIAKLGKDFEKAGAYNNTALAKEWKNKIPAVSSINIDSLTTIVCPFFSFIAPFQSVFFATRYALTNKVTYLASYETSLYAFRTLKVSVSFATVEDINEMQITAVSTKEKEK